LRAVLDPNVLISALLAPEGAPARVLLAWVDGAFELVVSPKLIAELERVLTYPKLSSRITPHDAAELLDWLDRSAIGAEDPAETPAPVRDEDDEYLLALAIAERALLVSGDKDLLALAGDFPVFAPAPFLTLLEEASM
jgi:putative PIN family toxin of toxin-antitoxin system